MDPTTRRRFLAFTGGIVATNIAGCTAGGSESPDGDGNGGDSTPTETATRSTPTGTAATTTAAGGDDHDHEHTHTEAESQTEAGTTVEMITDNEGSYFDPKGLLVEPGTTVRFVNASGAHTTTAYHPSNGDVPLRIPEAAEPWDSGTLTEQGAVYEVTFETEGVHDYYCVPHEMLAMVGRIVVGEPQGGPGTTEPADLPPAAKEALPAVDAILDAGTVAGP